MKKKTREERKNLIIQLVEDSCYVPMKEKELAIFMQVEPEEREELKSILQELLNEGSLQMTKRGKYRRRIFLYRRIIPAVHFIWIRFRWSFLRISVVSVRKPGSPEF